MLTLRPQKHLIFPGVIRRFCTVGAMKSPGADTNSAAAYYARGVELVRMSATLDTAVAT